MPAVDEAPAQRLTLAEFDGPGAPPDDFVQPPKGSAASQEAAPAKTATEEPKIAPLVEDGPEAEPAATKKPDPDEPQQTLGDTMDDPVEVAKRENAEKKAKEKADAEAATAAENETEEDKKKKADDAAAEQRDADLKYDLAPHTHDRTRKVITKFQTAAKNARDERDKERAERTTEVAALKKERDELAEKSKSTALPKETEEEIKTLRERVRELDISHDPIIQKKYDAKISANNESIVDVLKNNGLGRIKLADGTEKENPAAIKQFMARGITTANVYPLIVQLRKSAAKKETEGDIDGAMAELKDADELHGLLRDNDRVAKDKQAEIDSWKGDYAKRQQDRDASVKQQQEARGQAFRSQTDTILKSDLATLAKDFSYINEPPAPTATDTPATRKAKETAIAEWTAASKSVEKEVAGFKTDGLSPEKLTEVVGKLNASAIQAVVMKSHILPRVKREMAALAARNKELEAELGKIRDAGKLSRQHTSASGGEAVGNGLATPRSLDEALTNPEM